MSKCCNTKCWLLSDYVCNNMKRVLRGIHDFVEWCVVAYLAARGGRKSRCRNYIFFVDNCNNPCESCVVCWRSLMVFYVSHRELQYKCGVQFCIVMHMSMVCCHIATFADAPAVYKDYSGWESIKGGPRTQIGTCKPAAFGISHLQGTSPTRSKL